MIHFFLFIHSVVHSAGRPITRSLVFTLRMARRKFVSGNEVTYLRRTRRLVPGTVWRRALRNAVLPLACRRGGGGGGGGRSSNSNSSSSSSSAALSVPVRVFPFVQRTSGACADSYAAAVVAAQVPEDVRVPHYVVPAQPVLGNTLGDIVASRATWCAPGRIMSLASGATSTEFAAEAAAARRERIRRLVDVHASRDYRDVVCAACVKYGAAVSPNAQMLRDLPTAWAGRSEASVVAPSERCPYCLRTVCCTPTCVHSLCDCGTPEGWPCIEYVDAFIAWHSAHLAHYPEDEVDALRARVMRLEQAWLSTVPATALASASDAAALSLHKRRVDALLGEAGRVIAMRASASASASTSAST